MKLWTQHTHGAVELLRLRGKEQLQTRIGHQLFVHLRNQVVRCHLPAMMIRYLTTFEPDCELYTEAGPCS